MINVEDQEALFKLISEYLEKSITCIAIGGTAMMFSGYKTTTKDIDIIFKSNQDRIIFIKAIEKLGYKQKSTIGIYPENKHSKKPLMYSRGDERFDLFVKDVFGFNIEFNSDIITQRHDFISDNELIIYILPKEYLILLKSLTNRPRDFEDIVTIIQKTPEIDWIKLIDLAIAQKSNNEWILIDLEETLQKLKKITFLPQKYFKKIYAAQTT